MAASVGSAIELHGLNCVDIDKSLAGIDEDLKKEIADKYHTKRPSEYGYKSEYAYKTALQVAVQNNDLDIVRCLLKLGANPNKHSGEEYVRDLERDISPLYYSVKHGKIDILKVLMEKGADASIGIIFSDTPKGKYYDTPLTNACKEGRLDIVKELLKDPKVLASINTPLYNLRPYDTPLAIAILNAHESVANFLKNEHGAQRIDSEKIYNEDDFHDILTSACIDHNLHMVKMLLEKFDYIKTEFKTTVDKIDPDYISGVWSGTLYYAASVPNNYMIVEYVSNKGARLHKEEFSELEKVYRDTSNTSIPDEYMKFLKPVETPIRTSFLSNNNRPRGSTGPMRRGPRTQVPPALAANAYPDSANGTYRRRKSRKQRRTRKNRKPRKATRKSTRKG